MIPILRARERIQMAKSHHEEARNQQKEADMFGELCMRLLKPVGALTVRAPVTSDLAMKLKPALLT